VISVLSNVAPQIAHDIASACLAGNFPEGARLQLEYIDLCNDLFADVNPIPVKEAMNLMGWDVGACRLPLPAIGSSAKEKLVNSLKKHGLAG
jgi:4-hydroxy-tetrahydrodipicolinate synthase